MRSEPRIYPALPGLRELPCRSQSKRLAHVPERSGNQACRCSSHALTSAPLPLAGEASECDRTMRSETIEYESVSGELPMAEITAQAVNEFRKMTGLGLMECKKLLQEAEGDLKKAETLAKERGLKQAELRAGRAAKAGRIEVYIHHDAKSGVLVELNCETDFVARNEEFKQLAKDLALHIMATNPAYVKREDIPEATVAEQKRIFMSQVADKPANIQEKIAQGKIDAWFSESVLMDQKFVKDETKTIRDVILAVNSRTGENISVARFARFVVGEGR
jgi:elongation factor Ts